MVVGRSVERDAVGKAGDSLGQNSKSSRSTSGAARMIWSWRSPPRLAAFKSFSAASSGPLPMLWAMIDTDFAPGLGHHHLQEFTQVRRGLGGALVIVSVTRHFAD